MTHYHAKFTPRALTSKLKAQGLSGDAVLVAVEKAKVVRRALQSDREFLRKHRQEWRALLTPLRQELNHAIGGMRYDEDDVRRSDAFDIYVATLQHMYYKILALSETIMDGQKAMPAQTVAYLNETHAANIPNKGAHWVDWAPPKRKARVEQAFHEWMTHGTRKKHAKTKTPFLRVNKGDKFEVLHQRLLGAAIKEWDTLALTHEIALQGHTKRTREFEDLGVKPRPDPRALHLRLAKRVEKASRAVNILRQWTREDGALPRTWHGVLKKD